MMCRLLLTRDTKNFMGSMEELGNSRFMAGWMACPKMTHMYACGMNLLLQFLLACLKLLNTLSTCLCLPVSVSVSVSQWGQSQGYHTIDHLEERGFGIFNAAQTLMHTIAHQGCTNTVRQSALKADSGSKVLCIMLRFLVQCFTK